MNWALGESSDDDWDMMGHHMGGRLMYFLCIFGMS